MGRTSRHLGRSAPGLVALLLVGCVRRRVDGDISVYSVEPWAIVVTALVALAVVAYGWLVRKRSRRWAIFLIAAGVLVLCTTVPGLSLSRTVVDPDHLEWRRGFKFTSVRFDDLAEIVHTVKSIPIGRGVRSVHYLDFRKKSGETIHVQVEPDSDRYLEDAIPEILERARRKGVRCVEAGAG
jgi:hypothetical protein